MSAPESSKQLLIEIYGDDAVRSYEEVKAGSMRLGHALAASLLRCVGGREGVKGEPFDGVTALGQWEFCLQRNTKNAAGNKADLKRHPDRCVQILGKPNEGWMSAGDFLEAHGVQPERLDDLIEDVLLSEGHVQLRITA